MIDMTGTKLHCAVCSTESTLMIAYLGVCGDCVRTHVVLARPLAVASHAKTCRYPGPPLVATGMFLVPGYVTPEEVGHIARFIANISPHSPYACLASLRNFIFRTCPAPR